MHLIFAVLVKWDFTFKEEVHVLSSSVFFFFFTDWLNNLFDLITQVLNRHVKKKRAKDKKSVRKVCSNQEAVKVFQSTECRKLRLERTLLLCARDV